NAGDRHHVYGLARSGRGSIREFSANARGLREISFKLAAGRKASMRANIRFWTALIVIVICAFSVVRGASIVRFSLAMATIGSESRAEIIGTWATVPGVASTALQSKLQEKIDPPN